MYLSEFLIKTTISDILFNQRLCESIEENNIVNFFYDALNLKSLLLEAQLYGEPISIRKLKDLLRKKILDFEFIKLDSKIRPARGTTMLKYIPNHQYPKGTQPEATKKRLKKVATFFDLSKREWRSVSKLSKEIVIKKDIETKKPIVVIMDKPKEETTKELLKKPTFTPSGRVDDTRKLLHFRNKKTGATVDYNLNKKESENKLKSLGINWEIISDEDLKKSKKPDMIAKEKNNKGSIIPKSPNKK